jgi:hypothetical protein
MDRHSRFLIENSVLDANKLLLICSRSAGVPCQVRGLGQPCPRLLPPFEFAHVASLQCPSLGKEQVVLLCPTLTQIPCIQQYPIVSHLGLMGRILTPCLLLHGETAVLELHNGLCKIGNDFCLLLVCCDQLVNCIILLDGGICQVVKQCCHLLCLDNVLCSCLIGKGEVAGGHAVDVVHFCKRGHSVILPVVSPMVKDGVSTFAMQESCSHS